MIVDKLVTLTTGHLISECAKMNISTWRKGGAWFWQVPGKKPCGPHEDMRSACLNALYCIEEKK